MLRRLAAIVALTLLTFAAPGLAETVPGASDRFAEAIEVRIVEVEVSVRDRAGLPVTGLVPGDFRLFVDGAPVAIEAFDEWREAPSSPGDDPSRAADAAAPVNVLVYIDEEFSLAVDLERVLQGLKKQLYRLRPRDRVAIVAWDGHRLEKLLDWSAPGVEVEQAIAIARSRGAWGLRTRIDEAGRRAAFVPPNVGSGRTVPDLVATSCFGQGAADSEWCAGAVGAAGRAADRIRILEIENRIDRTARAVAAATRSFTPQPGRRILALLSGGWANGARTSDGRLAAWDPVLDVADELRYSIYAIDVPGMSGITSGEASRQYSEPRYDFVPSPAHATLGYLAAVTGGEALLHGERREVFARVAREAGNYYSLAFSAPRARDDAQHRIRVEVTRAGVEVRSRQLYRDLSESTERDYALETALLDGGSGRSLSTLDASLGEPVREKRGKIVVPLKIEWAPGAGGEREVELRVAAVDEEGRRVLVGPVAIAANAAGAIELPLRLRHSTRDLAVSVFDPESGESRTANLRIAR